MVVKQIYSLIEYDEAVKTMEAGADNIGLVPMQNGGVPAHRVPIERVQASWRHLRGYHADQRSRRDDRACQRGAA